MESISEDVRNKIHLPADSLFLAKKKIDECIAKAVAAGLTNAQAQSFYDEALEFIRNHGVDRNRFELSMESMWNFDKDFRKAISVALAQDLFIFVFKFLADNYQYRSRRRRSARLGMPVDMADRETDPPEIRARKAMLRLVRPSRGDTSRIADADITASGLSSDVVENIRTLLGSLGRQGVAWSERKGDYIIENDAVTMIEISLENKQGQQDASDRLAGVSRPMLETRDQFKPAIEAGGAAYHRDNNAAQPTHRSQAPANGRRGMRLKDYMDMAPSPEAGRSPTTSAASGDMAERQTSPQSEIPAQPVSEDDRGSPAGAFESLRNRKRLL
jgi:hypothetical protein